MFGRKRIDYVPDYDPLAERIAARTRRERRRDQWREGWWNAFRSQQYYGGGRALAGMAVLMGLSVIWAFLCGSVYAFREALRS